MAVYSKKGDDFEEANLDNLKVDKFLDNKSTLLKLLPPTEDALIQHVKRAALATLVDKAAHVAKPEVAWPVTNYGWSFADDKLVPVPTTQSAWPDHMSKKIACGCMKGCNRNCSCNKKEVPYYIGCRCQASKDKCSRAKFTDADEESSGSDSD